MSKHLLPAILTVASAMAQTPAPRPSAMNLPTDQLISEPGPAFRIADSELGSPATIIAYGDTRFTDPSNVRSTNPKVRRWLVEKIASEKPAAILINGDLPLSGGTANDYVVYQTETQIWRDNHVHVFQTLGNHEFGGGNPQQALENWWSAFPEMRNRRWYAAQVGSRVYTMAIDSDAPLTFGSDQDRWIRQQLGALPSTVDFLLIAIHHPPVADIQTHIEVDHNPRPNEIALRDLLSEMAPKMHARILVSAGHIHNYERNTVNDVVYLVSGGGGAPPYFVERTKDDQYKSIMFPNYHYVKLTLLADRLHAEMVKLIDPEADQPVWQVKDTFDLLVKPSGR
ncbi:MAG TPA: metallophosphoesterase [Bryobacteraceae bacterium]|nr:metallophosphoesterase [Bryobacteraceae bacterium]